MVIFINVFIGPVMHPTPQRMFLTSRVNEYSFSLLCLTLSLVKIVARYNLLYIYLNQESLVHFVFSEISNCFSLLFIFYLPFAPYR